MIIASSRIDQETIHTLSIAQEEISYRKESQVRAGRGGIQVSLSREAMDMSELRSISVDIASKSSAAPQVTSETEPGDKDQAKLDVLLKTLEQMTGRKFHFSKIGFTLSAPSSSNTTPPSASPDAAPADSGGGQGNSGNTVRQIETYTKQSYSEEEATSVSLAGVVKTTDGKEIALNVDLLMSRAFTQSDETYSLTTAPLTDPLVISYDGNAADLTEMKYTFDLNADGTNENISFVTPGSGGFLALDRNGDGTVTDGSELFGTVTGSGFAELAAFDQDKNGWIDGGDAVYSDLKIWEKTASGEDRLIALADTGIGAIYLNAAESPFRITDIENTTLGQVRATSVYLREDGGAGVVQQIDLAT